MTERETTASDYADRLAIRQLVERYAHCADRRLIDQHLSLFTADAQFVIHMDGEGCAPSQVIGGLDNLKPYLQVLDNYEVTQHFLGQSTVALDGDTATGETYCTAYHVHTEDGERKLMTVHLRYLDEFARSDGAWRFAKRTFYVDWIEPLHRSPDVTRHIPAVGQSDID
ncbi:nuclear transport factor 2 family protein [Mycobacterium sp. C31M]